MAQNRWIQEPRPGTAATVVPVPGQPAPRGHVPHRSRDPRGGAPAAAHARPPEPRVRVHFTRIEVNGHLHEIVCSFLLDAMYGDDARAVLRGDAHRPRDRGRRRAVRRYGEPKKLAQLEFEREGDHVHAERHPPGRHHHRGRRRRHRRRSPVPEPYDGACSSGTSSCPRCRATGFDAGPFLVTLHQTMKPETCERVDGKLVLRDLPGTPVADLPVLQYEGARFMMTSSDFFHVLEDVEIDPEEYAKHVSVQYR